MPGQPCEKLILRLRRSNLVWICSNLLHQTDVSPDPELAMAEFDNVILLPQFNNFHIFPIADKCMNFLQQMLEYGLSKGMDQDVVSFK